MRRSHFLFALLQLFSALCFAQAGGETVAQKMELLLKDAGSGFASSQGEQMGERGASTFFKSKVSLGGSEAIVLDAAKGKKTYMSLIKQADGAPVNITALQTLIERVSAMQEIAKTNHYKFERKPMEGGGMRNTLHNEAGVLLMEFRHTTSQQSIEIFEI